MSDRLPEPVPLFLGQGSWCMYLTAANPLPDQSDRAHGMWTMNRGKGQPPCLRGLSTRIVTARTAPCILRSDTAQRRRKSISLSARGGSLLIAVSVRSNPTGRAHCPKVFIACRLRLRQVTTLIKIPPRPAGCPNPLNHHPRLASTQRMASGATSNVSLTARSVKPWQRCLPASRCYPLEYQRVASS